MVWNLLAGPPPHGEGPDACCGKDVVTGGGPCGLAERSVGFAWCGTSAAEAVSHVHKEPRKAAGRKVRPTSGAAACRVCKPSSLLWHGQGRGGRRIGVAVAVRRGCVAGVRHDAGGCGKLQVEERRREMI
jgi:hypothetical protein